jgi:DNA-binding MarR family transcriptional regulator
VKKYNRRSHEPFVRLPKKIFFKSDTWKDFSPAARDIYCILKVKYNGSNNGELSLTYKELQAYRGLKKSTTITNGMRELEKAGWIERTKLGGLYRTIVTYKLTGKEDDLL